ncbi:FAD-dependent oxidoreductase [Turicimonas muris]|uniref:FAD-dependent oxidoreductase n=1 Tax=Turicimonas muris TaxID=1796652 RepID=UPI0023F54205|nr:flavocytochrome c [Turicimonas muris]
MKALVFQGKKMLFRREVVLALGSSLTGPIWAQEKKDKKWDVIVVGSGVAGLSAACAALQNGAHNVLILEKSPIVGGHSILSTGYVAGIDRKRQEKQGIVDSPELMLQNMLEIGGNKNDVSLAKIVCYQSESTINWLEELGIKWDDRIFQTVAGLHPRSHITGLVRAGHDYVMTLLQYALKHGAKLNLRTRVLDLIEMDGKVIGVNIQNPSGSVSKLFSRTVILATGGFTANVSLRMKYDSRLGPEFPTTANPFGKNFDGATGDGLIMAQKIGAATKDVEYLQLIPFWGGRLLDYVGGDIYVNIIGKRFVNEAASWKEVSDAILLQPQREIWAITDAQSQKGASLGIKLINKVIKKANSIEEMASEMKISPQTLRQTIDFYNQNAKKGKDPIFGKNIFTQTIDRPPYYFGKEKLGVHFCCGGIKFNQLAEVVKTDGDIIPGLYVCGEASGGPHGHDRLGGVALMSAFVFGKIAGIQASKFRNL